MIAFKQKTIRNFWKKVQKTQNCWLWTGSRAGNRYGAFYANSKYISAHKFSYKLHNGEIPIGINVCHSCDNIICVNPRHLFLGTTQDNVTDKMNKNRYIPTPGESHGNHILTEQQVLNIRSRPMVRGSLTSLSVEFGVHIVTISDVIHRKTWKHI